MTSPVRPFARVAAAALAVGLFALAPLSTARAGDAAPREGEGEGEGASIGEKIKAQMEKIVRLMKENEKAILEASQGSGKATKPVDVKPPDVPPEGTPPAPPPAGMSGGDEGKPPPGEHGDDIRRKIEELIKGTGERGQQIPSELEELIRMIPVQQGQSPQPNGGEGKPLPDPNEAAARKRENQPKPEDGKDPKGAEKDPKSPAGERKDPSTTPPKPGEEGPARREGVPAWLTELPNEVRKAIEQGDSEKIPVEYLEFLDRYKQYLQDLAGKR